MDKRELIPIIEAILFAAGFPVKYEKIAETLEISVDELKEILESDAFKYEDRGIRLVCFSDSCQLCTNELYESTVKTALGMRHGGALSNSSMETLAIIAYNKPVTKSFIEQVRGVDCSGVISTLCQRELIKENGRLDLPGRPLVYCTTDNFLRCFEMSSLDELPELPSRDEPVSDENDDSADFDGQMSLL
jgi:segregation and condensation protein B